MQSKIICAMLIMLFVLSLAAPVLAAHEDQKMDKVISYLAKPDSSGKPGKPAAGPTVSIRNIPAGDNVFGKVLVVAQASGANTLVCKIVGQSAPMQQVAGSDRWTGLLTTTGYVGAQTMTVEATSSTGKIATTSISVNVASAPLYELNYEIDYVVGYEPSSNVLSYLQGYWGTHAIQVNFRPGDAISDDVATDGMITESDFWYLENKYNQNSPAQVAQDISGNWYGVSGVFTSKEKWMLYGSWDTDSRVGGYTYVISDAGKNAGNYIFIADGMIRNWEGSAVLDNGGEVIVTCHEAGHSIGILVGTRTEKYDTDYYSIMSLMRTENAGTMQGNWYYSKEYWSTADLGYYLK
jgi:hypothetical protein